MGSSPSALVTRLRSLFSTARSRSALPADEAVFPMQEVREFVAAEGERGRLFAWSGTGPAGKVRVYPEFKSNFPLYGTATFG